MAREHPTYTELRRQLESARSQSAGKPLSKTTRLFWRGDAIAVRLHNTDIGTIYPDGHWVIAINGWNTVTTKAKLCEYTPVRLCSGFDFRVQVEHDPEDPEPMRLTHVVPKPFETADPGEEPLDDHGGCIAGTSKVGDDGIVVRYISERWGQWVPGERRERCPHCSEFAERHERWHVAMHGARWGRGYTQMCAWLEEFGSREAWQEAYIENFRERRQNKAEIKAWDERNTISLLSGPIVVTPDGYAPLKGKAAYLKKLRREARELARYEREQAAADKVWKAERQREADKAREQREVAHALASALALQVDTDRRVYA